MKNKIIGIFLCMLMIGSIIPIGISAININKTIYVDDDNTEGPWDGSLEHPYQYIQDGIDNADPFDTVYVLNGVYYGDSPYNLLIDKPLCLKGESKENTIIDAKYRLSHNGIFIMTSWLTIKNFTITNGEGYGKYGIHSIDDEPWTSLTFENLIIYHFQYGFVLTYSDFNDVTIENCEIYDLLKTGIEFNSVSDVTVKDTSMYNIVECAIYIGYGNHITINNCELNNCGSWIDPYFYFPAISIYGDNELTTHVEIYDCKIHHGCDAINVNYIKGAPRNGNAIYNNEIYDNDPFGIRINVAHYMDIYENEIYNNEQNGIGMPSVGSSQSTYVTITDNNIYNNGGGNPPIGQPDGGINLKKFSNSIVQGNTITSNEVTGIYLKDCHDCQILDNTIRYSEDNGIYLVNSQLNSIIGNIITDSSMFGIILSGDQVISDNIISGNTVANIEARGCYMPSAVNENLFYHNNFISNEINANDFGDNLWYNDMLREGNYWDDWLSNPGFPFNYQIPGGDNIDYYPLLFPENLPSINLPPNKPYKPVGRTYIHKWRTFYYSTSSWDVNGDHIYYLFDWGDGTDSGWLGPYNSGQIVVAGHQWSSWGTYSIKVKAKDEHGYEGAVYSESKEIHVGLGGIIEGTMISMWLTGSQPKPIQDIEVGDIILSYDELTETLVPAEVIRVHVYTEDLPPYFSVFNDNLKVTPNKDIYVNGTWDVAEVVELGDELLMTDGQMVLSYPVTSIAEPNSPYTAYDLEIQPIYSDVSGYWADGILVASAPIQ